MEKRKELFRLTGLCLILLGLMAAFLFILYDLQIVHAADYYAKTTRSIGKSEDVAAARGEVSDAYGRPLITNQVVYQVTLDASSMGQEKNDTLLELIRVAQAHNVTWPDNLPISHDAPYYFRLGSMPESQRNQYNALAKEMGWKNTTGDGLLAELRESYKIDESLSDADARLLAGILYELSLRSKEIIWSGYVFATDVDIDFISAVRERGLSGVDISPVTIRNFNTSYAAHLLGRTGLMDRDEWKIYKDLGYAMNETVGKDGVEKAFESILRGSAGTRLVERNASGKITGVTWKTEPGPGSDIRLTIDLPLQRKVEDTLAQMLPTLTKDVEGGAAVVVDVHSAAVLASGSYPTFDLAAVYKDASVYAEAMENPLNPFYNRAMMGTYSPGSTFKMLVATAGLEKKIITPKTLIKDTGVYRYYRSPQPACWVYRYYRSTHGSINVSRAIEVSCNVFFYDVGRRVGIDTIGEFARKFGLGQATGIEVPERTGVVAGPEYTMSIGQTWYEGNVLSAAIGQENNQFTPLQLANYAATLANGGTRYSAHLLKSVKPAGSDRWQDVEPQVVETIDISPANLAAIKKGMVDLTTTGSLRSYFKDLPFKVAAKTGSAQVAGGTSNAVFVCFAPADDPQVALALVAEHGGSGSDLAKLAAEILNYYLVPRSTSSAVPENTLLS